MATTLRAAYLLALIVWLGEIIFFSFVGAPAVFRNLDPSDAGRVVSRIFAAYYVIGYACGIIMLVAAALLVRRSVMRTDWLVATTFIGVMLAFTLYAGLMIQPRASALRPQLHDAALAATVKPEFDRLHRLAVVLNGAVLLGGLVVAVITARSLR